MYNMKLKKGTIFILMGLLLIVAALSLTFYNIYDSKRAEQTAKQTVIEIEKNIPNKPDEKFSPFLYSDREMPTTEIDGYRYIGIIKIPELDITLPVMEEWDYNRLNISSCRYSGSFYKDNMVIAGHNYQSHFGNLNQLVVGSEIIFTDVEGNIYNYEVAWTETLKPSQTEEMIDEKENDKWDLTLFTCTISGSSRFTVRCVKISEYF